jgi:hypothetical protein
VCYPRVSSSYISPFHMSVSTLNKANKKGHFPTVAQTVSETARCFSGVTVSDNSWFATPKGRVSCGNQIWKGVWDWSTQHEILQEGSPKPPSPQNGIKLDHSPGDPSRHAPSCYAIHNESHAKQSLRQRYWGKQKRKTAHRTRSRPASLDISSCG